MGQIFRDVFQPGVFSQTFMIHAFVSGTVVAIVAALVGYFVVLRGSTFVAHALPKIGFAGAAGSVMLGINPVIGLAIFSVGGALSMGWLGKRGNHDVVTALTLVAALGTGSLFLSLTNDYAAGTYALLFGQLVGVSSIQIMDTVVLGSGCILLLVIFYRPLLFASISKEGAAARSIPTRWLDVGFLLVVGIATALTVPVVGALLSFSLVIGPTASTFHISRHPVKSLGLSVVIAVITVWVALLLGYDTGWPIGFFAATLSALCYGGTNLKKRLTR